MIRLSTGFVTQQANGAGVREICENMVIEVRTGLQPATADSADSGMLLWKATNNALALTGETRATATIGLATAAANLTVLSLGSKTLGANIVALSALPAFSTAAQLAIDTAALINASGFNLGVSAVASGTDLILTAPKNTGAFWNDTTVYFTAGVLDSSVKFAGGVTCINGLKLPVSTDGVIEYNPDVQTWSGRGVADGTPQHFRIKCSSADDGTASTVFARIDGNVAQIGGDMRVSVGDVKIGKLQIIEEFKITLPKQ